MGWLDGICEIVGPEAALPAGGYCKIRGWRPENAADYWKVIDQAGSESETGVAQKETRDLNANDIIVGVALFPAQLEAMVASYGRDFFMITTANGSRVTCDQWEAIYGTNGLGLVAIRNMNLHLHGGGIQF